MPNINPIRIDQTKVQSKIGKDQAQFVDVDLDWDHLQLIVVFCMDSKLRIEVRNLIPDSIRKEQLDNEDK